MVLDNEILEFQNYIMAKYAIHSLDEAKEICKGKGLDIEKIVKDVKPTSQEECVLAFTLGAAIAIRKGTRLASYAAIDLGEGIQTFLGDDFDEAKNGFDLGFEMSRLLKNTASGNTTLIKNYNECIPFLDLTNNEIYKVFSEICFRIEAMMR